MVSENTVAQVMRELGFAARRKKRLRQTTRKGRGRWRAPDLVGRKFAAEQLNRRGYGDGTEVPTDEGKLHLDSVLDMASRRIVGFVVGEHHDAALATTALRMAVTVRGGKPAAAGVLFHSDQGSEYTAAAYQAACGRLGVTQSMAGSGPRSTTRSSRAGTPPWSSRSACSSTSPPKPRPAPRIADWIEEYNHERRHSSIGMLSPVGYERQLATPATAAAQAATGREPAA